MRHRFAFSEHRFGRREVRTSLALLGALLLAATSNAQVPDPAKGKDPKAKTPVEQRDEALDKAQDAFENDLTFFKTFTKTIPKPKPEDAALAASKAAASDFLTEAAVAAAAEARFMRAEADKLEATVPLTAQKMRGQAKERLEKAMVKLAQAKEVYTPPVAVAPTPTSPSRPPVVGEGCGWAACRDAIKIGQYNAEKGGSGAGEFSGPGVVLPIDPGSKDRIFRGGFTMPPPKRSPDGGALVLPQRAIDVEGPLRDAVAQVEPAIATAPLVLECGGQPCMNPSFLRLLADRTKREALQKIGGVSLAATFDLLADSGLSELSGGMDIAYIERPVLVSLRALLDAASAHVANWDTASDDVRYPGNLGRVHGFVLNADGSDVLLVGTEAQNPGHRIDIDEIVLALQLIWRDGKAPAVSLDPRPDQVGGPLFPRMIDLPGDSIVAAIMIEADYAMKPITLGAGWAASADPIGLKSIVMAGPWTADGELSRFWLSPKPLAARRFYRSASGRTVLFETEVQVQTESMIFQNGAMLGQGTAASIPQAISMAFNAALPALETDGRVQPSGIFARLHGLIDLSTMASSLRSLGLDSPVLRGIAALPYRRLAGAEAVQASYPGLHGVITGSSGPVRLAGGAQLSARQNLKDARGYADHVGRSLERMADGWGGAIFAPAASGFALSLHAPEAEAGDGTLALKANNLLEVEDWAGAQAAFSDYVTRRPDEALGYRGQAMALMGAGKVREAALPAARALLLEPEDRANELLIHDLAWRTDPSGQLLDPAREVRTALAQHYAQSALAASAHDKTDSARRFAEWAIALDRDNADARITLAYLHPPVSQTRERELAQAARAYRRAALTDADRYAPRLAYVLTIAANHHLQRGLKALDSSMPSPALIEIARNEAAEAARLDPRLPEAAALSLQATGLLTKLARPDVMVSDELALEMRDLTIRFPLSPGTFEAAASLLALDERYDEAIALLGRAMSLAPADPWLPFQRATILAAVGRCEHAATDHARALRLAGAKAATLDLDGLLRCPAM